MMVTRKMKGSTEEMGKICEVKRERMWENKDENWKLCLILEKHLTKICAYLYTQTVHTSS
jgi:hypothetical protein